MRILFYDTKSYTSEVFNRFNRDYGYELRYIENKLDKNTAEYTKGFDAICAFVNDRIDKRVIDILVKNKVGLIALRCAGFNNVDVDYARGKIKVVRVPDYSPYAVAEHTIALIMALNRKTHKAYLRTKEYNFALKGLMGFDMHGKTAGVIGTGKIGKGVINILKGFGCRIIAYDPFPDLEYASQVGISFAGLNELFEQADIITLHCPLTDKTKHIIDKEAIDKMKSGVMLINTSRGGLIDTEALINGLKNGKIACAGLDVYEEEERFFFEDLTDNILPDDTLLELLALPNVLVTSHQAFFTKEAVDCITKITLENIKAFDEGKELENAL